MSAPAPAEEKPKGQRKMMSFPPLVKKWTVKSEASWPGAEYTRRTRLHTNCVEDYSQAFLDELKETLGDNFDEYYQAMRPAASNNHTRGRPPAEHGPRPVQAPWKLKRAEAADEPESGMLGNSMSATTRSLSGHLSRTKQPDFSYTSSGPVPVYMFEDREQLDTLSAWFDRYGRPTPSKVTLGPRQPYTRWEYRSKRCCGEPSQVQTQYKGFITN